MLFAFDVIHGYKNVFPMPIGMAATWNMDLIEKAQEIAALEAWVSGINWTFGPMVDLCRDAQWGRIAEGAGEDPVEPSSINNARFFILPASAYSADIPHPKRPLL
jgi:beta-glucosidase